MPIFMQNLRSFWELESSAEVRMELLAFFAPMGLRWLDSVRIHDDESAMSAARWMAEAVSSIADWSKIAHPLGGLKEIVSLDKRLKGLLA